jgi:hypothetical protein
MKESERLNNLCRFYIELSTKYQESIIAKKPSEEISQLKAHLNKLEDEIDRLMTEIIDNNP